MRLYTNTLYSGFLNLHKQIVINLLSATAGAIVVKVCNINTDFFLCLEGIPCFLFQHMALISFLLQIRLLWPLYLAQENIPHIFSGGDFVIFYFWVIRFKKLIKNYSRYPQLLLQILFIYKGQFAHKNFLIELLLWL